MDYDVFLSHASEDKIRFVDALVSALRARGLTCWYDSNEIRLGDDFCRRMNEGLASARYGVVVLSPNFFKYWPEAELSALFNQEATLDQKRILPVRLDLDRATLTMRLPLLAARADIAWDRGCSAVADRILDAVRANAVPPPALRSPLYNVPVRRAQRLFGREDAIEQLLALLAPGKSVRIAASIEGLAGVGKTELALHTVDRLSGTDRFPGGIFWIDAENPDLAAAWGGAIADELAVGPGTIDERAAAAVRIASSGSPALVVLDNVEQWTRESEPHPLPRGPRVALLVTTRRRFLAGPSFEHHTLEVMEPSASRSFLSALAGRDLNRAPGTEDLLVHLDGHALALELAGAYLREFPDISPQDYLGDLATGKRAEDSVRDLVRYERTVREALDSHERHLEPPSRRALRVAACFGADDASTTLLKACGVDPDLQMPLRRLHLIAGDGDRWRMHRLVRAWVLDTASREEIAEAKRDFVEGCVRHAQSIDLAEGFSVYRKDSSHLDLAVAEAESVLGPVDERVSQLLDRVGTALQSAGDLPRAKALLEQALASDLKHLGEDHPSVATRRSNLALALQDLGDPKRAKALLEQALAWALKNLRDEHPSVAICRSNLASVLQDLGDLARAKALLEQALASDLKHLGEDHPSVALRRSNLALVLKEMGDPSRAKALLEQALALALKNLGEDHPSVATSRSNLASVLQDLGDLPRAKALLEQALASDLKNLGEDHPSVATRRSNLALVLKELGDPSRAKALLEQALASAMKNLGEDHPSVATSRSNLALVLQDLGDLPRAKALLEQALASDLKNLGEDHASVASSRSNLALVLDNLGDLPRAKALLEQALASDLKNLGENHPSVATRRFNLASIYASENDLDRASELLALTLLAEERSLGADHPSTAVTRVTLADVHHRLRQLPLARDGASRALQAVAAQPADSTYRLRVERIARAILE